MQGYMPASLRTYGAALLLLLLASYSIVHQAAAGLPLLSGAHPAPLPAPRRLKASELAQPTEPLQADARELAGNGANPNTNSSSSSSNHQHQPADAQEAASDTPQPPERCSSRNKQRMKAAGPVFECYLEVYGYGERRPGVRSLHLNCSSPTDPTAKLLVGVPVIGSNQAIMSEHIAEDVAEQLTLHSTGVSFNPNKATPCQQKVGQLQAESTGPEVIGAVLYFCTGTVNFIKPIVKDVWLPAASGFRIDTTLLYIGGDAHVTMTGAQIIANNASASVLVNDVAYLGVEDSTFSQNLGDPGAGIFSLGSSILEITRSVFTDNHSRDYGGALALMMCSHVTVRSSVFSNNSADVAGGTMFVQGEVTLLMQDSMILDSSAENAGGLMCYGSNLLQVRNTSITASAATGDRSSGGGIGGVMRLLAGATLELSQSVVSNNTAEQGGGVALDDSVMFDPTELLSSVVNNTATVTDADLSTTPDQLEVVGDRYIESYVAGSDEDDSLLRVQLLLTGHDGLIPVGQQRVEAFWESLNATAAAAAECQLSSGDCEDRAAVATPKATAVSLANGTVNFALRFRQPPGNHTIVFQTAAAEGLCLVGVNITVNARVRACKPGEREVRAGVCDPCAPQTFSFIALNSSSTCNACPEGAECPGADVIVYKPGWWQSSLASGQMHRCPNPSACSRDRSPFIQACVANDASQCTDSIFVPNQCAPAAADAPESPYMGSLCGVCAPGFGSSKPFTCTRCMHKGAMLAIYAVGAIGLLLAMKLMCRFTLKESQKFGLILAENEGRKDMQEELPDFVTVPSTTSSIGAAAAAAAASSGGGLATAASIGRAASRNRSRNAAAGVRATHLVRHLVLHCQWTLLLGSIQLAEAWPGSIAWALQVLAWMWAPATPAALAPECLNTFSSIPAAIQKLVFFLVVPLVMLLIMLVIETVCTHFGFSGEEEHLYDRLLATCFIVMFFFLPTIASTAFSLFACIELDKPSDAPGVAPGSKPAAVGWFFMHDLDQVCFSAADGWHRRLALGLGIPLTLLVLAVPICIVAVMLRNWRRRSDAHFLQHFYFLVQYYSPTYCWYEAVVISQTLALVFLSVFGYSLGPYRQALAMNIVIFLSGVLLLFLQPLRHREAKNVAVCSMVCLFLMSYTALTFAQFGVGQLSKEAISVYMGLIVVVVNVAFVAWVLWQLWKMINWRGVWQQAAWICRAIAACDLAAACAEHKLAVTASAELAARNASLYEMQMSRCGDANITVCDSSQSVKVVQQQGDVHCASQGACSDIGCSGDQRQLNHQ